MKKPKLFLSSGLTLSLLLAGFSTAYAKEPTPKTSPIVVKTQTVTTSQRSFPFSVLGLFNILKRQTHLTDDQAITVMQSLMDRLHFNVDVRQAVSQKPPKVHRPASPSDVDAPTPVPTDEPPVVPTAPPDGSVQNPTPPPLF